MAKKTPKATVEQVIMWHEWMMDHVEFYSEDLSRTLAYLWPCMLKGSVIEISHKSDLVCILKDNGIPKTESIWQWIITVKDC